jgi:hypothetical protein
MVLPATCGLLQDVGLSGKWWRIVGPVIACVGRLGGLSVLRARVRRAGCMTSWAPDVLGDSGKPTGLSRAGMAPEHYSRNMCDVL